jgi:tRNA (Thr-GGU) A37 N-methylase
MPASRDESQFEPEVLEALDGNRMRVRDLEAIDGTPIVDVKPVLSADVAER